MDIDITPPWLTVLLSNLDSIESEFIGTLEEANAYVRDLDVFINIIRNFFLATYRVEKRAYEEGLVYTLYEPKIKPRVDRAKYAIDFGATYASSERLSRMDLATSILVGAGIVVTVWIVIPISFEYKMLSSIIILFIFASLAKVITRALVHWAIWISKKLEF